MIFNLNEEINQRWTTRKTIQVIPWSLADGLRQKRMARHSSSMMCARSASKTKMKGRSRMLSKNGWRRKRRRQLKRDSPSRSWARDGFVHLFRFQKLQVFQLWQSVLFCWLFLPIPSSSPCFYSVGGVSRVVPLWGATLHRDQLPPIG